MDLCILWLAGALTAQAAPPQYEVVPLPRHGPRWFWPLGITEAGEVVAMDHYSAEAGPFTWTPDAGMHRIAAEWQGDFSGFGMSRSGLVVGELWDGGYIRRAAVWDGSSVMVVPLIVEFWTGAMRGTAINDLGQYAGNERYSVFEGSGGSASHLIDRVSCPYPSCWELHHANAINDAGVIVGFGRPATDTPSLLVRGYIWDGGPTEIPPLAGHSESVAIDVLSDGTVLAASGTSPMSTTGSFNKLMLNDSRAFFWKDGVVLEEWPQFVPLDANEQGMVVGSRHDPYWDGVGTAQLRVDGVTYDLNTLVPDKTPLLGATLDGAFGINEAGQIVAWSGSYLVLLNPLSGVDLGVSIAPGNAGVTGELRYDVSVANHGSADAPGTRLVVVPPEGSTYVDGVPLPGSCVADPDVYQVSCAMGRLPAGHTSTLGFRFAPGGPGSYTLRATVSSDVADADPSNDTAELTLTHGGGPTVELEVPSEVVAGQRSPGAIVVRNPAGGTVVTRLALTFTSEPNLGTFVMRPLDWCELVPDPTDPVRFDAYDCEEIFGLPLEPGAELRIEIGVIPVDVVPHALAVEVRTNVGDPSDQRLVDVSPGLAADLAMVSAKRGREIGYDGEGGWAVVLTFENRGPEVSGGATLFGDLGVSGLRSLDAQLGRDGVCVVQGSEFWCPLGSIAGGESRSLTFEPLQGGTELTVEIRGPATDPDPSNNIVSKRILGGCAVVGGGPGSGAELVLLLALLRRRRGPRDPGPDAS